MNPKEPEMEDRPGVNHAKDQIARIIRVDQAGEYGAKRIYAGQLAVLGGRPKMARTEKLIKEMADQEDHHLETFNDMVAARQIRPTILQPIWHVAGFGLGVVTALMGEKAAMACTAAVEEAIDEHYAAQQDTLDKLNAEGAGEEALKATIDQFRADEAEHHHTAMEEGAEQATGWPLLRRAIKGGSKAAIWLSERF